MEQTIRILAMEKEIKATVEALRQGKVILYPTDTVWGIGCDATNQEAVERVFEIKNRPANKSLIVLVGQEAQLNKYVKEVPAVAWDLVEFADKPLTIIYDQAQNLAKNVIGEDGSIAIRVVKDEFCEQVLHRFGKAIVSTSANLSGEPNPATFDEIAELVKERVDYIVPLRQDERKKSQPSSIIKLGNSGDIKIIRK